MLVEKEVIRPGTYFYRDEKTGLPRKLVVTPELCRYWQEQGNKMLSTGLTVPVPCEHDFNAHPMTPADKLKNNAGWVREYVVKDIDGKGGKKIKDVLFSTVDVTDEEIRKKLPHTIRWTSPWINSFTDGQGREWKNVISHLALTTRPRIVEQQPFGSVAAALSMASEIKPSVADFQGVQFENGLCLSRAGRLFVGKKTQRLRPRYPLAFSLWGGGIKLAEDDVPVDDDVPPEEDEAEGKDGDKSDGLVNPLKDATGDIEMEELLCDLLQALGVPMPDESNEGEFKRHLYEAAMSKIKELTSKGMADKDKSKTPDQNQPPGSNPHTSQPANPLIQQEQQPMYMSLEEIHKLDEPLRSVALSMYNETAKAQAKAAEAEKVLNSLCDKTLREENEKRNKRVALLSRLSPRVKADLDAMLALPSMALSMGEGGTVVDPLASTLAVLEKGLADMPRLLTVEASALSVAPQPSDETMLSEERQDQIADVLARQMGAPPLPKKAV